MPIGRAAMWTAPAFLVTKQTNKCHKHLYEPDRKEAWRIVTDLRALNSSLLMRTLPVATLADCLDSLGQSIRNMQQECPMVIFSTLT